MHNIFTIPYSLGFPGLASFQRKRWKKTKNASSPEEQVVSSVVAHTPVKVEKQEAGYTQLGADHFLKKISGYAEGVMGTWYALYAHIF